MGTRWNSLIKAVLTGTHNLCFEQKYKKYQNFLSENFHFLVVKFSLYLSRHVFVMEEFSHQDKGDWIYWVGFLYILAKEATIWLLVCFPTSRAPSEKESTLKGQNVLPMGANFLLE